MNKLIYAIILTVLPVIELRGGMPLAVSYAVENDFPLWLVFTTIILLNIALIFFVFYFLDKLNTLLIKIPVYKRIFERFLSRFRKKVDKFENKYNKIGFFALMLFVAVPLPGTGAWSGCLVAWILGLDRKKSIIAIGGGIIIAGCIIFLGSLGAIRLFDII